MKSTSSSKANLPKRPYVIWTGLVVVVVVGSLVAWRIVTLSGIDHGSDHILPAEEPSTIVNAQAAAEIPIARSNWSRVDDPASDGWKTEVLSSKIQDRLTEIGHHFFIKTSGADDSGTDELDPKLYAADFRGTSMIPSQLKKLYDDGFIQVHRGSLASTATEATFVHQGISGLRDIANELSRQWSNVSDKQFEIKTFRINDDGENVEAQHYVAVSGKIDSQSVEVHSKWATRWKSHHANAVDAQLELVSIRLIEYERTRASTSSPFFADCTESALGANESFTEQFSHGLNYWLDRNQDMRYFSPLGNPGLTVGDVNGDGLDDLYVCQENNLPNRLFLQQPDGSAVDVSASWRADWLEGSRSALLLDLDNDGDQDLAVALLGGLAIASNEGSHFELRDVVLTDDDTTSLSASDFDSDGDLDIYVCVDYPNDEMNDLRQTTIQVGAASRVYHDANTAGSNSLFRNEASAGSPFQFTDVTSETGLDVNNRRFSWSSSWDDYDNDGDQDLYVANDFGRNNLYVNSEGYFIDKAAIADAEDSASGMSVAWSDVDRDGQMDLYIANMFSSAGNRITHQPHFKKDASDTVRSRLQRFARGSTLLRNLGDGTFADNSVASRVTLGRWAWGSNFLDINNDGWQDICVANGYITSDDTSDL